MICSQLTSLLGLECSPIDEDGTIALIECPFSFDDGDALPIFVQQTNGQIRFFDDGGVLLHFAGRGIALGDKRRSKFIRNAAEPFGANLSEDGNVEVWSSESDAPSAFANFLSTLLSIVAWEREQRGTNSDLALLVEEVAMCLRAWKPDADMIRDPDFQGISGQIYKLDFLFDGQGIVATSAHPNAVSSVIKKLLDIRTLPSNASLKLLAIIDDRKDQDAAKRDSLVIQSVSEVMPFTTLEQHALANYSDGNYRN